jgi:multiple sugar transport system substrate-binding protein
VGEPSKALQRDKEEGEMTSKLTRRDFLRFSGAAAVGAVLASCQPAAPQIVEVEKQVPVEKEVIKEVPVERVVEKVVKETVVVEKAAAPAEPARVQWYCRSHPAENPWERDQVIPRFEETHPDIKVQLIVAPSGEDWIKLQAMNTANQTPDLWSTAISGFTPALVGEMIRPITDYIDASWLIDLEDYAKSPLELFEVAGDMWGLPHMVCGTFTFFNKDLFDEAGVEYPPTSWDDKSWTWDEMVLKAKALTKNYGQGADAQYGIQMACRHQELLWQWGTDLLEPEAYETGYPCQVDLTSEEAIAAIQAKADLIFQHQVSPTPAEQEAISIAGNPFLTGKLAMRYTGGWGFWGNQEFTGFRWSAAPAPWSETNAAVVYPDGMVISRISKVPDATWQLLEYVSVGEGMKGYVQATGAQPAPMSVWDEWYRQFEGVIPVQELRDGMEGAAKYGRFPYTHAVTKMSEIITTWNNNLDAVWLQQKTVGEAMAAAEEQINKSIADTCGKTMEDVAAKIKSST